jgi:ubiquitin-conjugating enzyme E2 A
VCYSPYHLPQRLMRDFKRLRQDPPQGVNGSPNPDNIMLWNAVIFGPEDTPWDGGEGVGQHQQAGRQAGCAGAAARSASVVRLCRCCCCCAAARRCNAQRHPGRCCPAPPPPSPNHSAGTFKLTLEFTEDYPNKAPVVKFKSTMFHPNSASAARLRCSCAHSCVHTASTRASCC